jgi:hypothetical protein
MAVSFPGLGPVEPLVMHETQLRKAIDLTASLLVAYIYTFSRKC